MRGPLAAAAVVAVLTVTGCSGESGGRRAAGPLPAVPTVPTASPTPTSSTAAPLSKEQAAKRYLAIVKPYNLALERLEQAINRGQPVAMVRTLAGQVAVANQAHMRDLRATVWPVEVRALVRELVAESARAQASWRQAARATTRSADPGRAEGGAARRVRRPSSPACATSSGPSHAPAASSLPPGTTSSRGAV